MMEMRMEMASRTSGQQGFSLVELMISMLIASVILAGLYANFILQSRVANSQAERTSTAEDLQAAAQIMQRELRMSQAASLDCNTTANKVSYKDIDGNVGWFLYKSPTNNAICWDRPGVGGGCQELLRGLDPTNGMTRSVSGGVCQITLRGTFLDHNHTAKALQIDFYAMARN